MGKNWELERYRKRWNLQMQDLKEKDGEEIRGIVLEIFKTIVLELTAQLEMVIDTVHYLGREAEGKHLQIMLQFTMTHYCVTIWKLTKNPQICKDLKIQFKHDFCRADREA